MYSFRALRAICMEASSPSSFARRKSASAVMAFLPFTIFSSAERAVEPSGNAPGFLDQKQLDELNLKIA